MLLFLSFALAGAPPGFHTGVEGQKGFGPAAWSPDGRSVAVTRWDRSGLVVYTPSTGTIAVASHARGAGFRPDWDGDDVLFKEVLPDAWRAVEFDRATGLRTVLATADALGEPVAEAGHRWWARGSTLTIDGADGPDLQTAPHLVEPDPVGSRVAFVSRDGRLGILTLADRSTRWLTSAGAWSHPLWSPDGSRLLVRSPGSGFVVFDPATGARLAESGGTDPVWMPDGRIVYESVGTEGYTVTDAELRVLGMDGSTRILAVPAGLHPRYPAPAPEGGVSFTDTVTGDLWLLTPDGQARLLLTADAAPDGPEPPPPDDSSPNVWVPYMHQLWDTPDNFDGGWSCGPTSCTQILGRWGVLPNADITCSWPSAHTSHWGWYIPNNYSFNGYTYDTWGVSAGGDCQGAHGFICREYGGAVWAYMTDFMQRHGVSSWQAGSSWSTVTSEIDGGNPMYASAYVLGYGHIIVIRGYTAGTAMISNDPYGNAGSGDWGNDDGENAVYDWPGTNTGHLEIDVRQVFAAHGPAIDTGTSPDPDPVDTGSASEDPPPPSNVPPTALAGNDVVVARGETVTLDGSLSADPDGRIVGFSWILPEERGRTGALTQTEGATLEWPANQLGTFTFTLVATDSSGAIATDTVDVTVKEADATEEAPGGCDAGAVPLAWSVALAAMGLARRRAR